MAFSCCVVFDVSAAHVIPPSVVFRIVPPAPTTHPVDELIMAAPMRLFDVNLVGAIALLVPLVKVRMSAVDTEVRWAGVSAAPAMASVPDVGLSESAACTGPVRV